MDAKAVLLASCLSLIALPAGAAEWNTPESRARWDDVRTLIFGEGTVIGKTDRLVSVDAPGTAQDAALVPVAIKLAPDAPTKDFTLVIDQNPAPLAAKVQFGPSSDPRLLKLRVRVDGFTNLRAVVADAEGRLQQTAMFVKGAGGCSAPMGMSVADASAGMGEMRMKYATNMAFDAPQATLMIRHPNFNGMQKDPATNTYTPARFIKSISVSRGGDSVFSLESSISLSTNPVIEFLYKPGGTEPFEVTVVDTADATWTQKFAPPDTMN